MARLPDKPGTFRIRPKGFGFVLSGVTATGERVKVPAASHFEAERIAATIFPSGTIPTNNVPIIPEITAPPIPKFDDWGLPVVTADAAQAVASAMGIPPPQPTPSVAEQDAKVKEAAAKEAEKQAVRKKTAKSMAELLGHGYAMGVVMASNKIVTQSGRIPVKPSPKQVTDLAECTKDVVTEWFGDHEVKPWIMMVLLSIGIPLSMWIQSPKAPKLRPMPKPEGDSSELRSVT